MIKKKVMEYIIGMMVQNMKDIIKMIVEKDSEKCSGKMEINILEIG